MSKLILEFDDDKIRDTFLGLLSDGGIECSIFDAMEMQDIQLKKFDYKGAFPAWGWDGKGDPVVKVY